jgi:predicted metal-dependent peptidase
MIQALIIKKVLETVFKKIETKHKLNKLKKYVEEENELDIQVKQIQKTLNKYGKTIEQIEKNIAILKSKQGE